MLRDRTRFPPTKQRKRLFHAHMPAHVGGVQTKITMLRHAIRQKFDPLAPQSQACLCLNANVKISGDEKQANPPVGVFILALSAQVGPTPSPPTVTIAAEIAVANVPVC